MNVLLDTHAFLWWITDDPQVSNRARSIIQAPDNRLFPSAVSGWEIAIKARLGKLKLPEDIDVQAFMADQLRANAIEVLKIEMAHALFVYTLPNYHRDPFDRILVAQGQLENLPILTSDPQIAQYPIITIW